MSVVRARRVIWGTFATASLCAWCGWTSGFHHSSTAAFATWSASVGAVVLVDLMLWNGRRGRRPGWRLEPAAEPWPRPGRAGAGLTFLGLTPWLVIFLVVVAWEILGIDTGRHEAHLTISALAEVFRALNAALLLVWILVGIGYGVARAKRPVEVSRLEPRTSSAGSSTPLSLATMEHHAHLPGLLLPNSRADGVAFWVTVVVVCVVAEIGARNSGGRVASAQELVRLITRHASTNALVVAAWAYAGWHLFAH